MSLLDELLAANAALPKAKQREVAKLAKEATAHMLWVPNPGPQTEAYFSKADILLYGGEPGGGKSQLILGLAFNEHQRSLIMRRQYTDLGGLTDEALKINGSRAGFNGSPPPKLVRPDGRVIDFGGAKKVGDEQHWQGRPHDLIGLDEGTQFAWIQVRFLIGWMRYENPDQRTRMVIASNPPLSAEGAWVMEMFGPWLNPRHHNPAEPGELRYFISDEDGKDTEVDGPEKVWMKDRFVIPMSRTYIPASVEDNPAYAKSDYRSKLDSMGEPHRSILLGGFRTTFRDQENQVIPTAWVQAAQAKWKNQPPEGIPMCAMAVDCSGGGNDPMVIARRWDGWYAPNIKIPGKEIPMERAGAYSAGIVVSHRRDNALVVIDLGGGYGGPIFEHLSGNDIDLRGYKGAESTTRRSTDKKFQFPNKRSAAHWLFREALDPGQPGGSPILLPDDPLLTADLTAPTFEATPTGIKVESKEDVCKRLGRSTDDGDAVIMAWFEGPKMVTNALEWAEQAQTRKGMHGGRHKVVMGRDKASRGR